MKRIATQMGFDFHGGNFYPEQSILKSPLLSRGYRRGFGPAITGKHEDVEILVFEHVYSEPKESSDSGDKRYFRTVTVIHSSDFSIPEFVLVKKGVGDRVLEKVFGSESIHFEDDSRFSEIYALTGQNQDSARNFFTPELRAVFTNSKKKWAAGGIDNQLILMLDDEPDEQLEPEEFVDYLGKIREILNIIRTQNKRLPNG